MKGIVFTEFLEMTENTYSVDVAEEVIERSNLPGGGSYTAVGTYDYRELVQLVVQLSEVSAQPAPDLIYAFGKHLFARFVQVYPQMFVGVDSAFDFLTKVEDYIHVEVRKLYPDAELPHFETLLPAAERLEMVYHSDRPFADLAHGLIAACVEHFGQPIEIRRESVLGDRPNTVRFSLVCLAEVTQCSI